MKQKNANESLNVLKGIASLLVVLIHAPLAGPFGQYIIAVARSGVALFFLLSGYYMCSDDFSVTRVRAKRKLLHICNLALWANLFYLIWGVFVRYVGTGVSSVREWSFVAFKCIDCLLFTGIIVWKSNSQKFYAFIEHKSFVYQLLSYEFVSPYIWK